MAFLGFHGSYSTVVGASFSNLSGNDSKKKVHYFRETCLYSAITDTDLIDNLKDAYLNGAGAKLSSYYRYGLTKYYHGAPTGKYSSDVPTATAVIEYLTAQGKNVDSEVFFTVDSFDADILLCQWLETNYQYNTEYNEYKTYPTGVPVGYEVLSDVKRIYDKMLRKYTYHLFAAFYSPDDTSEPVKTIDIDTGVMLEISQTKVQNQFVQIAYRSIIQTLPPKTLIEVTPYVEGDVDNEQLKKFETISDLGYLERTERTVSIKIDIDANTKTTTTIDTITQYGKLEFFWYLLGSGNIPELDKAYPLNNQDSDFFASVPLRRWKEDILADKYKDTDEYKSSKAILKRADIPINNLHKALYPKNESHNDINKVNFAYFTVGVSLISKEKSSKEYMYQFFMQMSNTVKRSVAQYHAMYDGRTFVRSTFIPDLRTRYFTYSNAGLQIKYFIGGITRKTVVGRIGKINTVTVEQGKEYYYTCTLEHSAGDNDYSTLSYGVVACINVRKQITATTYIEIEIGDFGISIPIISGQSYTKGARGALQETSDTFIIPITYSLKKKLGLVKFTQLTTDCYFIVCLAYERIYHTWYESLVGVVVCVVAVVVSIYSFGAGYGAVIGMVSGLGLGAMATAIITAVIVAGLMVAGSMVLTPIINKGVKELQRTFGTKFPLLAAAALIVIGSVMSAYGISGGDSTIQAGLTTLGANNTVNQASANAEYAKMNKEAIAYKDFMKEMEELMSEFNTDHPFLSALNDPNQNKYISLYDSFDDIMYRILESYKYFLQEPFNALDFPREVLDLPKGVRMDLLPSTKNLI